MAKSQNGWAVVGPDQIDKTPINGRAYPNGFRKGDVWKAFNWLFTQLHNRVESQNAGATDADEWGYYVKDIEGSDTISNHASGTAGDYNASTHPMGVRNTYSASEREEIRTILREADGIFRWGGDYSDRPDDMHFEIVKSASAVGAFVDKIERDKVTVPTSDQLKSAAAVGVLGYTGGGLPGGIAGGNFLNYFTDLYRDIAAQSEDVDTTLDAIGAGIVNVQAMLATILKDPNRMEDPESHPLVICMRYVNAHPVS